MIMMTHYCRTRALPLIGISVKHKSFLYQRCLTNLTTTRSQIHQNSLYYLANAKQLHSSNTDPQRLKHSVLVSKSTNIFHNLALENYLYKNTDLDKESILFIYRNKPCIVIGRHQNPWKELDVEFANSEGVSVARRHSGGGTVYQDLGNMCFSFLTSRERYNRKNNLSLMASVLNSLYSLDITINERDDLYLEGKYKVSGTAAKLERKKAYHHFTLLLDTNTTLLNQILNSKMQGLSSKATESVKASVMNLKMAAPTINAETITSQFGRVFLDCSQIKGGIQKTEADNEMQYPGVGIVREELCDWDWIYGKTPPFAVHKTFKWTDNQPCSLTVKIQKGKISELNVDGLSKETSPEVLETIQEAFIGQCFTQEDINNTLRNLSNQSFSHHCDSSVQDMKKLSSILEVPLSNIFNS